MDEIVFDTDKSETIRGPLWQISRKGDSAFSRPGAAATLSPGPSDTNVVCGSIQVWAIVRPFVGLVRPSSGDFRHVGAITTDAGASLPEFEPCWSDLGDFAGELVHVFDLDQFRPLVQSLL